MDLLPVSLVSIHQLLATPGNFLVRIRGDDGAVYLLIASRTGPYLPGALVLVFQNEQFVLKEYDVKTDLHIYGKVVSVIHKSDIPT